MQRTLGLLPAGVVLTCLAFPSPPPTTGGKTEGETPLDLFSRWNADNYRAPGMMGAGMEGLSWSIPVSATGFGDTKSQKGGSGAAGDG